MNKYGFVYIWRDRKHNRYYIGCHWGLENDDYICSSTWMRNSYKRRPNDFKRRIVKTNIETRENTLLEEYKWLSMIKSEELGKKYYNLTQHLNGHWTSDGLKLKTVGEKISISPNRNANISKALIGTKRSEETKEKIRKANIGKKLTEDHKKKIGENNNRNYTDELFKEKLSKYAQNRSIEHRKKISENSKRLVAEGKIGMLGRKHSEETKTKMALSAKHRSNNICSR